MEPTYLSDYIRLVFRLGHMSASLGKLNGDASGVIAEWQDDIDDLAERMDSLDLPQSRQRIISFLEQFGDVTQNPDLLDDLTEEAGTNLEKVLDDIRRDAQELRINPGTLPTGVRDILSPRLLDALPEHARQEYEEAKTTLLARAYTSSVRSICIAVESTLGALYSLVTGRPSQGTSWEDMQREVGKQPELDGRNPAYIVSLVRDIQKNYRNPTAHPELRVTDDYEAYAAFYHCTEALRRMGEAILTKTMPLA